MPLPRFGIGTKCLRLLGHGFNICGAPQAGGYSAVFPALRAYERLRLKARVFLPIPEWDNNTLGTIGFRRDILLTTFSKPALLDLF